MNFDDEPAITLQIALDSMNADELRKLVVLTGQKAPGRKADMAALVIQHLAGERLRTEWEGLDELQQAVARLLDDVAGRTSLIQDRGLARLVECADAALAALIANDTRTRKYCMRAGERHLVVTGSSDAAFRRALRDAGYLLAADNKRPAKSRDSAPRPAAE
jgi:hypothetical protein